MKKIRTILIAITLLFVCGGISSSAYAGVNHSQSEAVAWISARKAERWALDYDGVAGAQCVDLIEYYLDYLVGYHLTGNAYNYVGRSDLPTGWCYSSTPSPGDVAVWGAWKGIATEWGHVALVESVGNGTFNYVDVNGGTGLGGHGTLSNSDPSSFIHPDFVATPTLQLSVERKYYNPGDSVTFSFNATNNNGKYTLGIFKELDMYQTTDYNQNSCSIVFNEVASYSAYATAYGTSGGLVDSNWVDWQVLPLTAELSANKTKCNVNDIVTLNFGGNNSNTFANEQVTLAVWCDEEYVVHKDTTGSSYDVVCDKPGEYKAYMTAYGGGNLADSNWVYWSVKPLTAELSADKTKCNVNDTVTLSFKGDNSNSFSNESITLAVWCNDEYVVHKDVTASRYDVICSKPGKYKAYMTAYGGGAFKDSNWVNWDVYSLSAELSADKTQCNVGDTVTLSFKGNNSNTFLNDRVTLAVWCNDEYVVHKDITDTKCVVTCDKPGAYKAYMTAYGGGTYKDSNWVNWTVAIPNSGDQASDGRENGDISQTGGGSQSTAKNPPAAGSQQAEAEKEPITINKVPASVKVKAKKNKVTVSWKKLKKTNKVYSKVKSIQVQYSTNPKFETNCVTKKVSKSKTKLVLKLKKKKTYFIRVRYLGKNGVSKWTKAKRVKTK